MYRTSAGAAPMGYVSHGHIYYVRGNANGKADVLWYVRFYTSGDTYSPLTINLEREAWESESLIKIKRNAIPSDIYPELKIQSGETKIIVECAFHYYVTNFGYKFTDGRLCKDVPSGNAFGFHVLNLKNQGAFFRTVVVFTPNPGLFGEVKPSY
ncbi:MAG: hypothetical protein LBJ71_00475 [Holosporaceae bacterium]|nr:hypothetical protein [Holosporaceae bacterium]